MGIDCTSDKRIIGEAREIGRREGELLACFFGVCTLEMRHDPTHLRSTPNIALQRTLERRTTIIRYFAEKKHTYVVTFILVIQNEKKGSLAGVTLC